MASPSSWASTPFATAVTLSSQASTTPCATARNFHMFWRLFHLSNHHVWRHCGNGLLDVRRRATVTDHAEPATGSACVAFCHLGDARQPFCEIRHHADTGSGGAGGVLAALHGRLQEGGAVLGHNPEDAHRREHRRRCPFGSLLRPAHGLHRLVPQCHGVHHPALPLLPQDLSTPVVACRGCVCWSLVVSWHSRGRWGNVLLREGHC